MNLRKGSLIFGTLFVLFFAALSLIDQALAHAHDYPNAIKFSIFPYKSPQTIFRLFSPIAKRIQEKTGKKVNVVSAPDFDTFVERGIKGEYDLALPCVTCFFMMQPAGYHVIARGEPFFHGGVITRKDSGITSLEQLKGKKIAAIGRHSFAGFMFLKLPMHERGLSTEEDMHFHFLKKNDSIIFGVLNKKYDAGVIRLDSLNSPMFEAIRDTVTIINKSPQIPQFPFVVKDGIDPEIISAVLDILTGLNPGNEEDKKVLRSLGLQKIVPAQDSDYDTFGKILKSSSEL
ncbi:MAG: phosphate/phosphite/phosphonate ABC transporter substrate-binding protein [Desulfobulbaceae bacterium]|nr:phosphate/phosphite/phosphonate ABC transporter substrate-binding protein [Desulfobulbaceae bacterium]